MFGSKFDNLNKLRENGFNIANFELIKFEDAISSSEGIIQIVENNKNKSNKELSYLLKEWIQNNINKNFEINLKCEKYAVRSSSNVEDGNSDSFAGQFDTYLNVSPNDLNAKIIECFKSLYNENVLDYICNKNINIKDIKMNVIIQEMVQSEYSGIIFTANPQGILNESVIVVGRGLGEKVVSDKINTTSYYYNLNDDLYYFEGENDYLEKEIIEKLINISQKIANVLEKYLDIEFGIVDKTIYILQARCITTIKDDNPLILDNSNIVESYPGVCLPLTISFVNLIYSGIFENVSKRILKNKKELSKIKKVFRNMVGSANGRMYYKISNWYTIIKYLPFSKKIIPIWQEMLGVSNKSYNTENVKTSILNKITTYNSFFYELLNVQKNMKKLNEKFLKINKHFYEVFDCHLNENEILKLYDEVEKELLSCWDITLINDMYAFIYTGILKSRLKKKYKNYEEKANEYISGITNIESMKPIREIIKIAYEKDAMSSDEYNQRCKKYIEKYGDRNLEELKLESLTFRTTPELLENKIQEYRSDLEKLEKIYNDMNSNNITKDIHEDFITSLIIKKCTAGIKNREISRLNRTRIFGIVRTIVIRLGEIYKKQGIISEKEDIFYLNFEEIKILATNKKDMTDIINRRKEDYKLFECLPAYTRIIFMNNEFDKHHATIKTNKFYTTEENLRGIPCSNGKVKGEVLVITNVNEAKDVKNKILVTKMTDPGWVFLLATAKGIITEKGSLLSHTAIISRELKIPSIVGVNNLLNTIKNGDIVEMDGTTGIINIITKSIK